MSKFMYLVGAGRYRNYWGIKQWMDEQNFTIKGISEHIGVRPAIISMTIRGLRNNRTTLHGLAKLGCPLHILSIPEDMKGT